jgi:hypothetical protein
MRVKPASCIFQLVSHRDSLAHALLDLARHLLLHRRLYPRALFLFTPCRIHTRRSIEIVPSAWRRRVFSRLRGAASACRGR